MAELAPKMLTQLTFHDKGIFFNLMMLVKSTFTGVSGFYEIHPILLFCNGLNISIGYLVTKNCHYAKPQKMLL